MKINSKAAAETSKAYITGIQYLRGLAAMAVCLFHISDAQYQHFPDHTAFIPRIYGLWGVDVFFVISGFIMVYITAHQSTSFATTWLFWKGRVAKIVPAYWLFTLVTALLLLVVNKYDPAMKPAKIKDLFESLFFLKTKGFPVLLVGWTLNYEMLFYLIFGLAMTWSHRYRIQIATFTLSLLVLLGLLVKIKSPAFNFLSQPILAEFVIGMIIGGIYNRNITPLKIYSYLAVVISLMVIVATSMMYSQEFLLKNRVFLSGIPAGFLVWGVLYADVNKNIRGLSMLGDISYSVYLSHLVVAGVVIFFLKTHPITVVNANVLLVIFSIPLTIVVSIVSHQYIEKFFTRFIK